MKQDNSPPTLEEQFVVVKKLIDELGEKERLVIKNMRTEMRRINKNTDMRLPLFASIYYGKSEVKAPKIKMLAATNQPGAKWPQPFRPFETADVLTKPENLFIQPEEIIKLAGDDFRALKLLNETSKVVHAARRKLLKILQD